MYKRLLYPAAFLLVLAMLAHWTMPNWAGIGAIFYMLRDAILLAALGFAALTIAIWWRWLPRDFA